MDDSLNHGAIAEAREILATARSIAVLTGAGISAESGIPTFRDALAGLWSKYRPEDLATPEAFRRDPKMVWDWYAWRRERVAGVQPNAGHRALAKLEADAAARGAGFTLVTQNVDGLHHAAGSRRIHELHGNIRRVKCFDAGHPAETWSEAESPPRCPICGSPLRPDVVWFGEMLPAAELAAATRAADGCDVFMSIGTSGMVEPAASLAFTALGRGATVIEVNPDRTPLTEHAAYVFQAPAGTVLPLLAG
ncbi:MAG TPA: NAD-dependent deacylase [Usitatibacter sp.]|nr:NAD-dependent deacylase [Usitatibacter sp.]